MKKILSLILSIFIVITMLPLQFLFGACKQKEKRRSNKAFNAKKIKQMQQDKHISNYRIYTDLKLNAGNINDYLTNGRADKLSLKTALIMKKSYCFAKNNRL